MCTDATLVREDGSTARSQILFVVRDDTRHAAMLFQTSDTTWQAYNEWGGNSLYSGAPAGRAYKVSYNRPLATRGLSEGPAHSNFFSAEYPMVRFLERNGYDVSYASGIDTDRSGGELLEHQIFMSVGHDEYWSGAQRANVEAARDAGVNLAFFSGNEMFWKTRWEPSIDGSGTAYRTLVSYKETHANAKIDPTPAWTGTWRDPRFSPPADGGRPENTVTGQLFTVNGLIENSIKIDDEEGRLRLWRNTAAASLSSGSLLVTPRGTLGYEYDEDIDNGSRPPGLLRLSTSFDNVDPHYLLDYGSTYGAGTATHHLTMYRAPSGARVFGAGTVQWSWGLDDVHDNAPTPVDATMQQATVNLFADMGVQPATLQAGLVPATQTTDNTGPVSTIVNPVGGSTVPVGAPLTISGIASDVGGKVGSVEVSTDGGTTWHPAVGRSEWTYTFTPSVQTPLTIKARAVDDSANLGAATPGVNLTVGPPATCPCSLQPTTASPSTPTFADPGAVELGVRFRSDTSGWITAVRFYKGPGNVGTHVGNLWSSTGTLLAHRDVRRRVLVGVAAGRLRHAGGGDPRRHIRRELLRTEWSLRTR